jgi:hypothetical protein
MSYLPGRNPSPTAFGEVSTAKISPRAQLSFAYGLLNSELVNTRTNGVGATVSASNQHARAQVTSAGEFAEICSKRMLKYSIGQGGLCRFTTIFAEPEANLIQLSGIGNVEDGFFVGYNGLDFGMLHRRAGSREGRRLTITAGAAAPGSVTVTLNGSALAVAVAAGDSTHDVARKIAAAVWSNVGTGWTPSLTGASPNGQVVFISHRAEGMAGVFSIAVGGTGVAGSFAQTMVGVAPAERWIYQSDWNLDKADGTATLPSFSPQSGIPYQIRYQWLGYGAIKLYVENPATGELVNVHVIQYADTADVTSIANPSLPMCLIIEKLAGAAAGVKQIAAPSMGAFVEGEPNDDLGVRHAYSAARAAVGAAASINMLTLRNKTIVNGISNRTPVYIRLAAAGHDINAGVGSTVEIRAWKNAVLDDTGAMPNFVDVSANDSVCQIDTTAQQMVSTGRLVFTFQCGKSAGEQYRLDDLELYLAPGDTLTLQAVTASGGGTNDIFAAINWLEQW